MKYLPKLLFLFSIVFTISCAQTKESEIHHEHHNKQSINPRSYVDSVNTGIIVKDTLKTSVFRMAMDYVGKNHVHIEYGSPGVRGRTIWGGLVAYDEVWVAGAHDATTIQFSRDVSINNKQIKKGKYALFAIPGRENWVIILNKNWKQHLADDYNAQDDVIRATIKPEIQESITQRLTYLVKKISNTEGEIVMEWEYLRIVLPFKNN
jgi:hypothetical protein